MSIYDLIFIAFFLFSVGTFLLAFITVLTQKWRLYRIIAKMYIAVLVIYAGAVLVSSLLVPRQEIISRQPLCFDDWCITVEHVVKTEAGAQVTYEASFLISSRAQRVTQRENSLAVYLIDENEKRYDPRPDSITVPFNTALEPHQSVEITRNFDVRGKTKITGLVIAHEGGFPIDWLIIGHGPFEKPPILRLDN